MIRRPPRFTRTDTLFPYTTRFRSGLHILFRDVEAGAGVVDIVEDRRPRDEAGDQEVAVARIGFVAGIVTRKADENGRSAERRGGKECVSTGRSRGSAYHLKNNEK